MLVVLIVVVVVVAVVVVALGVALVVALVVALTIAGSSCEGISLLDYWQEVNQSPTQTKPYNTYRLIFNGC